MSHIGQILTVVQLILFATAVVSALSALTSRNDSKLKHILFARRLITAGFVVSVICLGLFFFCFLTDDFSIDAVTRYSCSAQKIWYKLAAAWAGSAGSLLLWSSLVFGAVAICAGILSTEDKKFDAFFLTIASVVCLGFAALLVFVERPFAAAATGLEEGMGLNPLLRNFWMIIHPPLLFVGYAALAVPFVTALSAVFAGRLQDRTIYSSLRKWLLISLIFLTAGIATGTKWSYIELGWGGWWAWDAVESASLLPWLLSLAALHCITGRRFCESFNRWSVVLTPLAFIFSLVGAFITRSGVLASVHAFDTNVIFSALLLFIASCFAAWIIAAALLLRRAKSLKSEESIPLFGKAGLLKMAVLIFVSSAAVILAGIFWPLISRPFTAQAYSIVLTRAFYDRFITAAALLLVVLLGLWKMKNLTKRAALTGAGIAHLGFLLLVLSAAFSTRQKGCQKSLAKNESFNLGKYVIGYESFEHKMSGQLTQAGPAISVKTKRAEQILWPHKNLYGSGQSTGEVAVLAGLFEDLYVTFDGLGADGKVLISAMTKPFMFWLWFAMGLLTLGPAMAVLGTKKLNKPYLRGK